MIAENFTFGATENPGAAINIMTIGIAIGGGICCCLCVIMLIAFARRKKDSSEQDEVKVIRSTTPEIYSVVALRDMKIDDVETNASEYGALNLKKKTRKTKDFEGNCYTESDYVVLPS